MATSHTKRRNKYRIRNASRKRRNMRKVKGGWGFAPTATQLFVSKLGVYNCKNWLQQFVQRRIIVPLGLSTIQREAINNIRSKCKDVSTDSMMNEINAKYTPEHKQLLVESILRDDKSIRIKSSVATENTSSSQQTQSETDSETSIDLATMEPGATVSTEPDVVNELMTEIFRRFDPNNANTPRL